MVLREDEDVMGAFSRFIYFLTFYFEISLDLTDELQKQYRAFTPPLTQLPLML